MPIGIGEIDRICKEGGFVEWNVELKPHVSSEAGFGEEQISTACSTANCEVATFRTNLVECIRDCGACYRLLIRWKAWRLPIRSVDHVSAKQKYSFRRKHAALYGHHEHFQRLEKYS